ncbi:MAG: TolC family protein, partial [Spirochaetaceae bacterium]
ELTGRKDELSYRLAELLDLDGPVSPSRAAFAAPQPHDAGPAAPASGAADPASSVGAPASAGGPKIEAAKAQVAAARAGRRTAGYAFAPRVSGFYAETARSGPDLDFSTEWSAGVTMTISLLIGGERAARFATAAAELEAARSGRQAAELEHTRELRTAARSYELAAERRRLTERAVSNRERSLEAAQDRYEEGRASLGEMLDEERALLELEIAERTLLYEQVLASIAYYRTTGELTVDFARKLIEE